MAGHMVVHFGFKGHRSLAPPSEIVTIPDEELDEANDPCKKASLGLKRYFPPKNMFVRNLLRRNWFQVKYAERVYAVATLSADGVSGGTAWATQMFIDRHKGAPCECYVYDQSSSLWYKWEGVGFMEIDAPPKPHGVWAGIGSRDLRLNGKQAIRSLMDYAGNATPSSDAALDSAPFS
jgi:hypothetical protein